VLSTPPAFVLSQNQTLQTKTPHHQSSRAEFESEKSNPTKDTKNWHPKTITPPNGKMRTQQKQQQTKTTKHTIEFSNNTPARPRD
jgi:hypothetical protein